MNTQRPRLRDIILAACTVTEQPRHKIVSPARDTAVVRARWLIFSVARKHGFSYPEIGRSVGRDHTTVLHGMHMLKEAMLLRSGAQIAEQVGQVERIAIERSRRFFAKHMVNVPETDWVPVPEPLAEPPAPEPVEVKAAPARIEQPQPEEPLPPRPSTISPDKDYAAWMRSVDAYAQHNMRRALNGESAL